MGIVTPPASGSLVNHSDGTVTYTPNAGFTGEDTFVYTVQDDLGAVSNPATVTITVLPPPNQPPFAANDNALTLRDTPVVLNLTVNDVDVDGVVVTTSLAIDTPPLHGTLTNHLNGTVTYTPPAGFTGEDHFAYTVQDNVGAVSNIALVTVTVEPPNQPPVANADDAFTTEDNAVVINLLGNDVDADGFLAPATVGFMEAPLNGFLTNHDDGTVTYTPNTGFAGTDTFRYIVEDDDGALSDPTLVTVQVFGPGNIAPITGADAAATGEATPVTIPVLDNDFDLDGRLVTATLLVVNQPISGTYRVDALAGTVVYTPTAGFSGQDSLQYTVDDNDGATSAPTTVTLTVQPVVVHLPVANAGADLFEEAGDVAVLNGTGSSGDSLQFGWTQLAGPPVALLGADTAAAIFFFPDTTLALTFRLTVTDANGRTASDTVDVFPFVNAPPPSLKTVPVPEPDNLMDFVQDRDAAIALGKALFWDMQVGSDGTQACATCHYAAGTDTRLKNTLNPGANGVFDTGSPNAVLSPADFPFHTSIADSDDVVGAQGVVRTDFVSIVPGAALEDGSPLSDPLFNWNGTNVRQVTGRNPPSVINAVFNIRSFWDGRANYVFNGVNPFGNRDPNNPTLWQALPDGSLGALVVRLEKASLSSQAVGPPGSGVEMAWDGRTFRDLGRKLFSLQPLGQQRVDPTDSRLGPLVHPSGVGLDTTYPALIQAAFRPYLWDSAQQVDGEYTLMEANFSLFFGLAIQMYESTLVSDDSPYDRYQEGDTSALTDSQQRGLEVFMGKGKCAICHTNATFTGASFNDQGQEPFETPAEQLVELMVMGNGELAFYDNGFYNIGVRPTAEDPGVGGTDPFGNPLSFTRLAVDGVNIGPPFLLNPPVNPNLGVAVNGSFKTPSLRNVELTPPYMHNGSMATLRQVIEFYLRGGNFAAENIADLDANIELLSTMTEQDVIDLENFMRALTDERVRYQQAPFDHPQLFVPNGLLPDGSEERMEIPAVGAAGGPPLPAYLDTHPALAVHTTADRTTVVAGEVVRLTITVENTGDVPLDHVTVQNNLPDCTPAGPQTDVWASGVLDIGETWVFTCDVVAGGALNPAVTVAAQDVTTDAPTQDESVTTLQLLDSDIDVVKSASAPAVFPGEVVTYTYRVSLFAGNDPIHSLTIHDDRCNPLTRTGGDANGNEAVDPGEVWTYTCAMPLFQTTTNTVTVSGLDSRDRPVDWDDSLTVVVTPPDPAIDVLKSASAYFVEPGQVVTYTYQVDAFFGNVPLHDVRLSDDKCAPVAFAGGDGNHNGVLDLDEVWRYTCTAPLTEAATSIVTAIATDTYGNRTDWLDWVTVEVNAPGSITIINDAGQPVPFEFTFEGQPFLLEGGASTGFGGLEAGDYTITETPTGNWTLLSVACDNGFSLPLPNPPEATVTLLRGEHLTCTFLNERPNLSALSLFQALPGPGQVEVRWTTEAETGVVGFNLLRGTTAEGPFHPVNPNLILARGDAQSGETYTYVDRTVFGGETYYYLLQEVLANGETVDHAGNIVAVTPDGGGYRLYLPFITR
ncbi:MAG: tandem-95 repeat protein [Caldilineae bacterium]|nr:MAG: tandem-95 repeat protein [Caldilineae bacterium]